MSVDKATAKIGNSEAISSPSLKLSECTGDCNNISIMAEVTLANPDSSDITDSRPVPVSVALPNHTGSTGNCTQSENIREKVGINENHINRRNSFHHSKQQPQHQKLTKRRSTSNYGFKHPTSGKRRRRANSESDSVLPTNFLLGGNIFDPLNLNSLLDEEVNKALNAETPKSSPLPAKNRDPVEILIPRDITDPLNLNSGIADSRFLVSPFKASGRKRHRNRHHGGGAGGGASATQLDLSESGKSGEVRASSTALTPGAPASFAVSDVSRESSVAPGDSREPKGANATGCKEEPSAPVTAQARRAEDLTSSTSGRRKRRRNSGKTEPPVAQSTPVAAKPGPGDGVCGTGAARNSQSFHTPRSGPRAGPGGRQQQQPNYQQKHQQRKKFQYGNYNKYYGYRNPGASEDPRVRVLRPEWFQGKNVLDLGCNSGHLTLYIAKVLRPAHILGLDIDSGLVHAARKNIRHYLSEIQTQESRRAVQEEKGPKREPGDGDETLDCGGEKRLEQNDTQNDDGKPAKGDGVPAEAAGVPCSSGDTGAKAKGGEEKEMELGPSQAPPADHPVSCCSFPLSLKISRGPIAAPPLTETPAVPSGEFPSNVSFIKANYVLENDTLLLTQRPEYDVIMCLSVTKWVHLNWGDCGLKRLFQRVYRHLRPGGLFLLEPQPWDSYVRRKKLTDNISKHFHSIRLKPEQFSAYLTNEVGFSSYEFVGTPSSSIRGFQRPIYLFHK